MDLSSDLGTPLSQGSVAGSAAAGQETKETLFLRGINVRCGYRTRCKPKSVLVRPQRTPVELEMAILPTKEGDNFGQVDPSADVNLLVVVTGTLPEEFTVCFCWLNSKSPKGGSLGPFVWYIIKKEVLGGRTSFVLQLTFENKKSPSLLCQEHTFLIFQGRPKNFSRLPQAWYEAQVCFPIKPFIWDPITRCLLPDRIPKGEEDQHRVNIGLLGVTGAGKTYCINRFCHFIDLTNKKPSLFYVELKKGDFKEGAYTDKPGVTSVANTVLVHPNIHLIDTVGVFHGNILEHLKGLRDEEGKLKAAVNHVLKNYNTFLETLPLGASSGTRAVSARMVTCDFSVVFLSASAVANITESTKRQELRSNAKEFKSDSTTFTLGPTVAYVVTDPFKQNRWYWKDKEREEMILELCNRLGAESGAVYCCLGTAGNKEDEETYGAVLDVVYRRAQLIVENNRASRMSTLASRSVSDRKKIHLREVRELLVHLTSVVHNSLEEGQQMIYQDDYLNVLNEADDLSSLWPVGVSQRSEGDGIFNELCEMLRNDLTELEQLVYIDADCTLTTILNKLELPVSSSEEPVGILPTLDKLLRHALPADERLEKKERDFLESLAKLRKDVGKSGPSGHSESRGGAKSGHSEGSKSKSGHALGLNFGGGGDGPVYPGAKSDHPGSSTSVVGLNFGGGAQVAPSGKGSGGGGAEPSDWLGFLNWTKSPPKSNTKPPAVENLQQQGKPPAVENLQQQGKPPAVETRQLQGKPPAVENLQQPGKPPAVENRQQQGKPPAVETRQQRGKPPTVETRQLQGKPPAVETRQPQDNPSAVGTPSAVGAPSSTQGVPEDNPPAQALALAQDTGTQPTDGNTPVADSKGAKRALEEQRPHRNLRNKRQG